MSQHDYDIANASGASVRSDLNNVLAAIKSNNAGTSAPSSTAAGMWWLDTSGGAPYTLKIRDAGDTHWLTVASITDPGSDSNWATVGGGKCLQIQTTVKTDTTTHTTQSFGTDYIACAITPENASNKIWINAAMHFSTGGGGGYEDISFQFFKGGSVISGAIGDAASSRTRATFAGSAHRQVYEVVQGVMQYVDTAGGTSAITYSVRSNGTLDINKSKDDGDAATAERPISVLTLMEIAA